MIRRSIASIQIILEYAQEQGLEPAAIISDTKLSLSDVSDQTYQITPDQELKVLENLLHAIPDPFKLAVELGSRYQLTSYGIVGYAILSSATMRKAAEVGLRYLALTYAFADIQLVEDEQGAALTFSIDIPGPLGQLAMWRDLWAVSVIQRELFTNKSFPIHLQLDFPEPEYVTKMGKEQLETQLGGKITFNADRCAYIGLSQLLDQPLSKGNAITAKICEEQCSQLLEEKQSWQPVSQQVKDCLLHEGLDTSMEQVSEKLARTSRTLHRQLKQEGTSWREVRDQVRMGLAEELLSQPIQLEEIAERLGYSDATNFSHSFKRFKGITPSAFRKSLYSRTS